MGRWTQYDEDSSRLPEGMERIGYDADTARYTFRDREGNIYLCPAHEEYGLLTRAQLSDHDHDRPQMFASEQSKPPRIVQAQPQASGSTFHDFLPAHLITSAAP
ncbi:hypothetical protein C8R43DRAFT_914988, partial [Mycena crocata]